MHPRLLICFAVLALGGCPASSSNQSAADAGAYDDASLSCKNDPAGEAYVPGMHKLGKAGLMSFALMSSDPAPPIKGNNTWLLKLTDKSGNAIKGATFKVTPYMPEHNHGTRVVPAITAKDDGYQITPLYLYMRGIWQITIAAKTSSQDDSAVFSFCIE